MNYVGDVCTFECTLIYDQLLQSFINHVNWGLDNLRVASYKLIVCKCKLRVRVESCELKYACCEMESAS